MGTHAAMTRLDLHQKMRVPSQAEEASEISDLSTKLDVDGSKIPHYSKSSQATEVTLSDLLTSDFVDEPDQGMDQNLPASSDPNGYRKWMGGSTGPTSQGFRHMLFPGIEWSSPLATFQIPFHSVGQAIERIELLRKISRDYLAKGNLFWGIRTLLWELHYLQDLHQPFHVVQAPSLKMVPWNKLFSHFIAESTHALGNYHYAYEGLAKEMMTDTENPEFEKCFEVTETKTYHSQAELLALPRNLASKIGHALYLIFGNSLKSKEVDLPNQIGTLDYYEFLHAKNPDVPNEQEKKELNKSDLKEIQDQETIESGISDLKTVTCTLVQAMSAYTLGELEDALKSQDSTSKSTGK